MKKLQLFLTAAFLLLCSTANAQYDQVLRIMQQTNNRMNNPNYNSAGVRVTIPSNNGVVNSPGVYVPAPTNNNGGYVAPPPTTPQSTYSSQNQYTAPKRVEEVRTKCAHCGGDTKCVKCNGKGVVTGYTLNSNVQCASCYGSGRCSWCNGRGYK
jgi:hypothetical protein